MNYPANTIEWRVGDVVIHDADAKESGCLMFVVRVNKNGRVATRYLLPHNEYELRKTYTNDLAPLHDPARFPKIVVPSSFDLVGCSLFVNHLIKTRGEIPLRIAAQLFKNFSFVENARKRWK